MLEDSFLSVAGPGAGVDSLLDGLLAAVLVVLVFSFPLPKNSFAVEGWALGSGSGFAACAGAGAGALDTAGTEASAARGGCRAARRLTLLLVIVPYIEAVSRASSFAVRSWSSRVASERTLRSWFCQFGPWVRMRAVLLMDVAPGYRYVSKRYAHIERVHLQPLA
jgi:hypothetical protein